MSKKILKESIDLDFKLIAITAPLKDYVFCHKLNKNLALELCRENDHEIYFNGGKAGFSKFFQYLEETESLYTLVSNRSVDGILIEEMSKVDFFFLIHHFIDKEDFELFISKLRNIPEVQIALEVNLQKVKSIENLAM